MSDILRCRNKQKSLRLFQTGCVSLEFLTSAESLAQVTSRYCLKGCFPWRWPINTGLHRQDTLTLASPGVSGLLTSAQFLELGQQQLPLEGGGPRLKWVSTLEALLWVTLSYLLPPASSLYLLGGCYTEPRTKELSEAP